MSLNRLEKLLMETLKVMPPQSVYDGAERKAIIRGFQLFIDHRIRFIGWEEGGILVVRMSARGANVSDLIPVSVRVFLENMDIRAICSCSNPEIHTRCEHVVCTLVTLVHILKPNLFKMTRENPAYREQLEAGLLKTAPRGLYVPESSGMREGPEAPGGRNNRKFRVVMRADGGRLRAFVEMNGERVDEGFDFRAAPWEIAYLARSGYQNDMSYALSVFLKRTGNLYPLFYEDGAGRHKIEWLGQRSCPTWTELDARNGEIVARKACFCSEAYSDEENGTSEPVWTEARVGSSEEAWAVMGNFALNKARSAMAQIAPRTGWRCWDMLRSLCTENGAAGRVKLSAGSEIRIPVDVYRSFRIPMKKSGTKEALGALRCMVEGTEKSVRAVDATEYKLVIGRNAQNPGEFVIKPECVSEGFPFPPSKKLVDFARLAESGRLPTSLRTKKRKPLLFEALFRTLECPNRKTAGEALKAATDEQVFGRRKPAMEARRLVRESVEAFYAEEAQFLFADSGWTLSSVDKQREKLLFLVPYQAFGPALFERVTNDGATMAVSEELLLSRLYAFHSLATEMGIDLSFGDYPVESVAWDLEVDVTESAIDWFEISPEIRCNGKVIPREMWEQALARRGVVVRDGAIQILDETSMRALSALAGLWSGNKARAGARGITVIPRLRIIDLFLLRKQGVAVRLTAEDEALMTRLTTFSHIEERDIAPSLRADLRQYQKEGFYWLTFLYEHRFGACLADDMGLGKTLQAISLLAAIKEGRVARMTPKPPNSAPCPFLVVVPPSLIFNWQQEIERFCPDLKVYVYRGKDRSATPEGYDVILTSYGLIRRDIGKLKNLLFDVIVFDEAQAIKNIFADTTGAVRQLKGSFKMALTGTPVENHVGEYFSIMDLVLPGLLGDYRAFHGKAKEDLAGLLPLARERTKPFMLRRTKEHILRELPPKVEHDVYLELTDEQKRFYNRTVQEVRATIDAAYKGKTASQARIIALTAIMRLRQICLTPQLLLPSLKEPSPKVEFLKEKLTELFSESHSALVFSQFTSFLDVVEAELKVMGLPAFRLDGSTPVVKRKEIVGAFQESETPSVFLLSLKAGGQGLNLTRATYVFHLDPWWNPAVENQASDRSHRLGQTGKVHVTRLLMRHTVEEKMTALKNRKLALYRALMEAPERSGGRAVTREDFDFLLG
jgi:non-specific serine/threonine protein kinase